MNFHRSNAVKPSNKRKVSSVKGGMTSRTTLLTTYILPQIAEASRPAATAKRRVTLVLGMIKKASQEFDS
jgi:hypothetical protein